MNESIYYGQENQNGQWWDGKNWLNYPQQDDAKESNKLIFKRLEWGRLIEEKRCHPEGIFKCHRCRNHHNLVDTFDFLCDGCVNVLLHDCGEFTERITSWKERAKLHWSNKPQQEIAQRIELRDKIMKERVYDSKI